MRRHLLSFALLCGLVLLAAGPAAAGEPLPQKRFQTYHVDPYDWSVELPEAQGLPSELFERAFARAAELPQIYSILVVRHDRLIAERYFNGQTVNDANYIASTTKSFTSALVGIALEKGYIESLDEPMLDYFPQYVTPGLDPRKHRITIRDLLEMRAGYPFDSDDAGDAQRDRSSDWIDLAINRPLFANPGEAWDYSTESSHLLSAIVTEATGMPTDQFAELFLFGPLGIDLGRWDRGPDGYCVGGFSLHLAPRDMARFGQLFLRDGRIDGRRILSSAWIKDSVWRHSAAQRFAWQDVDAPGYGYHWWLGKIAGLDVYHASGHGGQEILNIPALDTTIVTTSDAWMPGDPAWNNHQAILEVVADDLVRPMKEVLLPPPAGERRGAVELAPCPVPGGESEMLCGSFQVPEDRRTRQGRVVELHLAVLPARSETPRRDPVFVLVGTLHGSAVRSAAAFEGSWLRAERDVVLVDLRGSGGSNRLTCGPRGDGDGVQGFLEPWYADLGRMRRCKRQLSQVANLRMYTRPDAVDDLDELRAAMGYDQVNLMAWSWGSRDALVYLRRHPESVRRVVLSGAMAFGDLYPLHAAADGERAFRLAFEQCAAYKPCADAFPEPAAELAIVLERLDAAPARADVTHPVSGRRFEVELSRAAFSQALYFLLFDVANGRWLPYLVHEAYAGRFGLLAQFALDAGYDFDRNVDLGLLLSQVCSEDEPRVRPGAAVRRSEGTVLGPDLARQIAAICESWPRAPLPASYGREVSSEVPVLIWSGTVDPVLPPRWGGRVARSLSRSVHLVVPAAHGAEGGCVDDVNERFLNRRGVENLGTGCTQNLVLPRFKLPG